MKLVGLVRKWIAYSLISILEPERKIVMHVNPYKFALMNSPKSCLKEAFQVKSVYLKLDSSKLSEIGWNG